MSHRYFDPASRSGVPRSSVALTWRPSQIHIGTRQHSSPQSKSMPKPVFEMHSVAFCEWSRLMGRWSWREECALFLFAVRIEWRHERKFCCFLRLKFHLGEIARECCVPIHVFGNGMPQLHRYAQRCTSDSTLASGHRCTEARMKHVTKMSTTGHVCTQFELFVGRWHTLSSRYIPCGVSWISFWGPLYRMHFDVTGVHGTRACPLAIIEQLAHCGNQMSLVVWLKHTFLYIAERELHAICTDYLFMAIVVCTVLTGRWVPSLYVKNNGDLFLLFGFGWRIVSNLRLRVPLARGVALLSTGHTAIVADSLGVFSFQSDLRCLRTQSCLRVVCARGTWRSPYSRPCDVFVAVAVVRFVYHSPCLSRWLAHSPGPLFGCQFDEVRSAAIGITLGLSDSGHKMSQCCHSACWSTLSSTVFLCLVRDTIVIITMLPSCANLLPAIDTFRRGYGICRLNFRLRTLVRWRVACCVQRTISMGHRYIAIPVCPLWFHDNVFYGRWPAYGHISYAQVWHGCYFRGA